MNDHPATPPPSDPLGVAAVTPLRDSIIEIVRGVGIDVYHCTRVWSAWNVGTMDQDDFEPFNESNSPEEIADAVLALIQPATPTREPAEGATPLTDAVCNECVGLKKDATVALVLRNHARKLETALAEAKARLAEKEASYLDTLHRNAVSTRQAIDALTAQLAEAATKRDAYESEAKSLNGFIAKANVENERLRAENERLAALVSEKVKLAVVVSSPTGREQDAAKLALENNDLRTQLTAAHAQIAAKDEALRFYATEANWYDYPTEERWQSSGGNYGRYAQEKSGQSSLEKDEGEKARQALSPSCGAELREELEGYKETERTLAQFLGKIAELLGLPPCDPPEILHVVKGITARNAKLEGFVKECANDDLDRVSGGIKQAARQALDSAQEGGAK